MAAHRSRGHLAMRHLAQRAKAAAWLKWVHAANRVSAELLAEVNTELQLALAQSLQELQGMDDTKQDADRLQEELREEAARRDEAARAEAQSLMEGTLASTTDALRQQMDAMQAEHATALEALITQMGMEKKETEAQTFWNLVQHLKGQERQTRLAGRCLQTWKRIAEHKRWRDDAVYKIKSRLRLVAMRACWRQLAGAAQQSARLAAGDLRRQARELQVTQLLTCAALHVACARALLCCALPCVRTVLLCPALC